MVKKEKHYTIRIHRLVALAFIPNLNNKKTVDHIDNVKSNNNINNLRWATKNEQAMNVGISKRNTSGYKGVEWNKQTNKWRACITINGNTIHLGFFYK